MTDRVAELRARFTEGSDSDVWTQGDVYREVFVPLADHLAVLTPGGYVIERYVYTRPNGKTEGVQWVVHRVEKDATLSQLITCDSRRAAAHFIEFGVER